MPDIVMPKMGDAMEEGTILRWYKHEGDSVEKGESIAEIETDKANMEMEAFDSGTITALKIPEGQTVPVGTVIAELGPVGAEVAGVKGGAVAAEEAPPAPPAEERKEEPPPTPVAEARIPTEAQAPAAPEEVTPPTPQREPLEEIAPREDEMIKASPLARKFARDAGIDLAQVEGSGPSGRIVEEDVRRHIEGGRKKAPAPPPAARVEAEEKPEALAMPASAEVGEEIELSRIRKTVGKKMVESKKQIPHFFVTTRVRMDEAMALRKRLNEAREGQTRIGVTDMLIKACALALMKHPDINSTFQEGKLIRRGHANIGIAVALNDGLIAPVVPECENKSLSQISEKSEELVEKARTGKIRPEEYSGRSFTISNMGMFDVEEFQAIIVPPESAILAVGTIYPTPTVINGSIEVAQIMKLTISADHRVTDGAGAARFLQDVKRSLENPLSLLQ